MVSLESLPATSHSLEASSSSSSSPRFSFSSEFLDESNFISICPSPQPEDQRGQEVQGAKAAHELDFEFLSGNITNMITADELFSEGKLLPFWHAEKLSKINLKPDNAEEVGPEEIREINKEESKISWFLDDDPSPRPPKCTVLWKELLRLRKQRASTLSPSSSSSYSSSSSSSSSSRSSLAEISSSDERKERVRNKEKIKKGLERTRTASFRIRPMINVPICTQSKNSVLPPLCPSRKGRLER